MTVETTGLRSRRAVLAAAAAAAAATAVAAVERPLPVAAVDGDVVHQGDTLYGSSTTSFIVTSGSALEAMTNGTEGAALRGHGLTATGVLGMTNTGTAVEGDAIASGVGVHGQSDTGPGIRGWSNSGTGVDADGGTAGTGVRGWTPQGVGVVGSTNGGTGVRATATTGTALDVVGRARFSRSGRAKVAAGARSVVVDLTAKGGLAGGPLILATLQYYRSGVYVAGVRPNYPSTGKFRIYLNKEVTSATYVGWLVVG